MVTPSPGFQFCGSVLIRKKDRGNLAVPFRNDVDPVTGGCEVAAQQSGALSQGILVSLLVISAEFFAPIAAMVSAEEG